MLQEFGGVSPGAGPRAPQAEQQEVVQDTSALAPNKNRVAAASLVHELQEQIMCKRGLRKKVQERL